MEAQLWALEKVGVIIGSFLIGFLFFYIISPFEKKTKKHTLDQLSSLLINFVIYIWLGKIVLNLDIFVTDPLAILAYPSDSSTFYFASFLIVLQICWKVWRKKIVDTNMLVAFVPIFLVTSFVYEFIQMFWYENSYSWLYIGLLTFLIILYLLIQDKMAGWKLSLALMVLWCAGQIVLSFILPFATVFTYIMSPWYVGALLLLSAGLYIYLSRKLVAS